jgi:hypothetical protein
MQAFAVANSSDWNSALIEGDDHTVLDKGVIDYRKSSQFQTDYALNVLSEFYFTLKGQEYCILLTYYNASKGLKITIPIVMVKKSNSWQISTNKNLIEFSGYMFIKSDVIRKIIKGQPSEELSIFTDIYCMDQIFRTDKGFFLLYLSNNPLLKKFSNLIIAHDIVSAGSKDIQIKSTDAGSNRIGIASKWSLKDGKLMKYSDESIFVNQLNQKKNYTASSGEAIVSWIYEVIIEQSINKNLARIKNGMGSIRLLYSINFYDQQDEYVLIYYDENVVENNVSYNYGQSSILLKKKNDQWYIDFGSNAELKDLIFAFNQLSFDALRMLFDGDSTTDSKANWYLKGNYLGRKDDGTIYINTIQKYFFDNGRVPDLIKRKPSVLTW